MIKFAKCQCQVEKGNFNINEISLNCPAVWSLISSGHTVGVFQLEKSLGQEWAKRVLPDSVEELAALISLIRPGPLEAGLSQTFVDVKFGRKQPSYLHPSLKPILESTYAQMTYQEQALRIATDLAGFNPDEADTLRSAIGKKLAEKMASLKNKFITGCQKHSNIDQEVAEEIFGWIEKCQRYSFNLSHAISYAMISYQTCWLKCHFPQEFFTSYLTYSQYKSDPKEEIYKLVQDARLFGVDILPPDIRRGNIHFQMIKKGVAFGLAHIRGVGTSAIQKIVTAATGTPGIDLLTKAVHQISDAGFATVLPDIPGVVDEISKPKINHNCLKTWADFLAAVPDFHRNVGIALIKSGACDCYDIGRNEMVRELEVILGTSDYDSTGKKIAVKGLTSKEKIYFFNELQQGEMTTPEILLQMAQPPGSKTKKISVMSKTELVKAATEYLDQVDTAFNGIVDGDSKFVYTSSDEKEVWLNNLKSRTKKDIMELMLQNGYKDIVVKPPCSSDARRKIVGSKAALLEDSLTDTNMANAVAEKYFLGIALSCSEVDDADGSLATHTCLEIAKAPNNEAITACVIIDKVRHTKTKRGRNPGQSMAFLTISDSTYSIDAVVFPDVFGKLKAFCKEDLIGLIYGEKKNGSFIVRDIQKLM